MGLRCLLHLTLGIGLISCFYMSTERTQDLDTSEGPAITEVEGYGPSGPEDQQEPGQTPLEVHLAFHRQPPVYMLPGYYGYRGLARLASTEVNGYLAR